MAFATQDHYLHIGHITTHIQALTSLEMSKILPKSPVDKKIASIILHCGRRFFSAFCFEITISLIEALLKHLKLPKLRVDRDWLPAYITLSQAYVSSGDLRPKTILLVEEVARNQKEIYQENRLILVDSEHLLLEAYCQHGQGKKAVPLLEPVIKIQATLPEDERDLLTRQIHAKLRMGLWCRPEHKMHKELIEILEPLVGVQVTWTNNKDFFGYKRCLADAYSSANKTEKAISLLESALGIQAESSGHKSCSEYKESARPYRCDDPAKEAIKLAQQMIRVQDNSGDEFFRRMLRLWLVSIYEHDNQLENVIRLCEQLIDIGVGIGVGIGVRNEYDDFFQDRLRALLDSLQYKSNRPEEIKNILMKIATRPLVDDDGLVVFDPEPADNSHISQTQLEKTTKLLKQFLRNLVTFPEKDSYQLQGHRRKVTSHWKYDRTRLAIRLFDSLIESTGVPQYHFSQLKTQFQLARLYCDNTQIIKATELLEQATRDDTKFPAGDPGFASTTIESNRARASRSTADRERVSSGERDSDRRRGSGTEKALSKEEPIGRRSERGGRSGGEYVRDKSERRGDSGIKQALSKEEPVDRRSERRGGSDRECVRSRSERRGESGGEQAEGNGGCVYNRDGRIGREGRGGKKKGRGEALDFLFTQV